MTRRHKKEIERLRQIKFHCRSKMCGNKKAYSLLEEAEGYAKMYSDPRWGKYRDSTSLRPYFCPYCHKFHLTSKEKVLDIH